MEGEPNVATELIFYVNGKKVIEPHADPEWTLLWYLRKKLRLTGTKLGCAEGGCGACTVMVSKYRRDQDKVVHLAVNACLAPVCAMHGLAITTVEGIGSTKTKLHPVQERIAKAHGSQCGFCTPGIVMSMYSLLRSCKNISYEDLEVAFQGNLCRCTGYRAIIEGYKTFIEDWEKIRLPNGGDNTINGNNICAMGKNCCKNKNKEDSETENIFDKSSFLPYDPSQEPIFPPELRLSAIYDEQYLKFIGKKTTWYRPTRLKQILHLKEKYPDAKIVVGNTEVGVEVKFKHFIYPVIIMPSAIADMNSIDKVETGLVVGAAVTLMDLENSLKKYIKLLPSYQTRNFIAIIDMLQLFAGKQIRNVAAIGGNIMTGSPISDLNPILMSLRVKLNLISKENGHRSVLMDETFFTGYRRNVVKQNEILQSIEIPFTNKNQYVKAIKQAKRREDDISIVTAAINAEFDDSLSIIKDITIAFGGMAPVTKIATKTCESIKGMKWNEQMLEKAYFSLLEELPLDPSAPGGNIQYRRTLTMSLFFKVYLSIIEDFRKDNIIVNDNYNVDPSYRSGAEQFHGKMPKSSQYFELVGDKQKKSDAVGRPIPHTSAFKQAAGEAVYCDDMPKIEGELYLAFVLSTKAHAKLISVDPSDAMAMPGVEAFFSAKDLTPEQNMIGPIFHDEELFASDKVISQGQTIGAIVACDQATAQEAARKVKIVYEELQPVIITIEDAIKHNSFYPQFPKSIIRGDVKSVFENENNVIFEGECRMGGQEHFYLETHAAFAIPKKEDDELEIFCSSQHPTEIAKMTSHILHVPINRIVARVKRLGGGFGGKESRGLIVALPVALAAHKLNRPVRCMLDRDEDMMMTGTRHPFLVKYKAATNNDGKLQGAVVDIYNNGGYSMDLSGPVVERAMFHFENAYYIPHVKVTGHVCRTNLPSNTAFRGFGGPQGMFGAENMIRQIANKLGKCPLELSRLNLYKENMSTHYGQVLTHCTLQRCWDECVAKSNLSERQQNIREFNKLNRWRKRGISVIPTKFGIAFTEKLLNQAGALIIIYTDGSVLVSHGGTEMGQGLHTKMIQVVSRVLEIDISKIHISETSTDKVPNTSATAASAGSDLNGMAVLEACMTLKKRLQPFKDQNPNGKWEDWVSTAYVNRVSLSATGFYATPDIGYNFKENTGTPFNYFTYGVACTEVEIDCLSGDHRVLRTDIVMDLGESLNPAIDIGQIEGAFIQGYGLFTMEELIYSPTGTLYSRGPGAYKIPGFGDIPLEFNVSLLKGAPNPRAVYSSKAVGEPPLFLASSAYFAIVEAIKAARADAGVPLEFKLDAPATAARIRMACQDHITKKLTVPDESSYVPWNVVP